jgi:hypothetical protein
VKLYFYMSQSNKIPRTHRERKEAYVASLESEVVRLRANEARLASETKSLYAENHMLKELLAQNGISIPSVLIRGRNDTNDMTSTASTSPWNSSSPDGSTDDNITLAVSQKDNSSQKKNQRKQIRVQLPQPQPQPQSHSQNTAPAPPTAVNFSQPISPPLSGSKTSYASSPINAISSHHLGNIDPEVLGMDFVLTLESPCLSHTDVATPTSQALDSPTLPTTTGHALTLSACIFHSHPSPPGHRLNAPTPWRVPRATLAQLLHLSSCVPLADGEVTPIQAWEYVRQHEGFAGLEMERWEALKEKLVGAVRCYGFGGVVERHVLESCVFEAFVVGRVF